jgi:hypothetical protein
VSAFSGGSAYAMASQIAEGYILLSPATLRKFQLHETRLLEIELDKLAREIRAENPPADDIPGIQKKGRKLVRINQAGMVIRSYNERR